MFNAQNPIKRVCIYGVGGVGGYWCAKIVQNLSRFVGEVELYFIARGDHLQKIKENGLVVSIGKNEIICNPNIVTDNYAKIPNADLTLVCVKSYDLENCIYQITNANHSNTIIIPLLNGIDIYEKIRKINKTNIILPACVYIASYVEMAGRVRADADDAYIVMGKDPMYPDLMPSSVLEFFKQFGIKYKWFEDPSKAIWEKYLFVSSFALVTAWKNKTIKQVITSLDMREVVLSIMREIVQISNCVGINLSNDTIDRVLQIASTFPDTAKTSFQRDIERERLFNEGSIFGGTIIRLGQRYGIPTPMTSAVYQALIL